jgi:hypothetical protein
MATKRHRGFSSLRAGGDMPPRKTFALRTIRLVNKGIGDRGPKSRPDDIHRVILCDRGRSRTDVPDARTRHNRNLVNRQQLFLTASGGR